MVSKVKKSILVLSLLMAQMAFAQKSVPWRWQVNQCTDCGISLKLVGDLKGDMAFKEKAIRTAFVLESPFTNPPLLAAHDLDAHKRTLIFLQTLSAEKKNVLNLYKGTRFEVTSQEYNLLAQMAFGILGQESRFFGHWKYFIKRNSQRAIREYKEWKAERKGQEALANSKGPTQIKNVPDAIADFYKIQETELWQAKPAAVATIGFLIEALHELKSRAANNNWEFVTKNTYVDYLPYIYFGGVKKLRERTATPDKNIYVQNMKKQMKKVVVSEIVP